MESRPNLVGEGLKYHTFVESLKNKRFKNIIAFTGPGIGVPDFKSR